jgi:hypothetical protein
VQPRRSFAASAHDRLWHLATTTADQTLCPLLVKADIRVLTMVRVLPIPDLSDIGQSHTR